MTRPPGSAPHDGAAPTRDYPLFLDISGRLAVVVGGGPVGQRRVAGLLESGARVRLVSPWATEDVRDWARAGRIEWVEREFAPADIDGAWLAHACSGDADCDDAVAAAAESAGVWCVRADDASRSSAWTAATARSADGVQFAVNGGRDPGRAKALRDRIAELDAEGSLPLRRRRAGPNRAAGGTAQARSRGKVYLVGAGPGDPDLLTVRARRALAAADVVVTDRLAPVGALAELDDDVEIIDVGKTPGHHAMRQEEINNLLVERASRGGAVVRFKGGDPFLLGRGGEEALACLDAGVDVEVVPGVTSALSVPAAVGIPVTHRGVAASVLLLSAHDGADDVVRRAARTPPDTTLVLLMGVRHLADTARGLVAAGRSGDLPAAVIANGWTRQQRIVTGTLATIAEQAQGIGSPAIIVVGDVAALHERLGLLGFASPGSGHGDGRGVAPGDAADPGGGRTR